MSEQTVPMHDPQVWPHLEGPVSPPRKKRFTLKRGLVVGAVAIALLAGIGIGQATAPTRKECAAAFGYSEKSMQDASDAMTVIGNAFGGGLYAMASVPGKLDPLTADIKKNTPLYQDAKAACTK